MNMPNNIHQLFSFTLSPSMETPAGCDPKKSRVLVCRGAKPVKVYVKKQRALTATQNLQ